MSSPVLVDIFGDIVAATSVKLLAQLQIVKPEITAVNYLYGMPLEIPALLTTYNDTPQKYPLIAFFLPAEQTNGNDIGIAETDRLRFIIAAYSGDQTKRSKQRFTENFKPILYPIFDEFLNQMFLDSRLFITDPDNISYIKKDWPFWDDGKDTNPFNDVLDVIEVNFTKLKINLTYC